MHNDIFSIGPLTVHGYGLCIGLGIVAALILCWRRGEKRGIAPEKVSSFALLLLVFGFLGAKALFLLTCLPLVRTDPLAALGSEGFVVYGGILAGLAAAAIWAKRRGEPLTLWSDLVLPGVALAQAFGRVGCFLAGCCYGAPTGTSFGVVFPAGGLAPAGVRLWPTQLFSAAGDLVIAVILLLAERRSPPRGRITRLYLLLYAAGRFALEFLRSDPRGGLGPFSSSQWISLLVLAALAASAILRKRKEAPQ